MNDRKLLKEVAVPVALEECVQVRSGKTPSRSNSAFWSGSVPWFSGKDLKAFRLDDSEEHISEAALADGAPIASAGEILLLVRGMTLLKDVPVGVLSRDASFNQDLKALRPCEGYSGAFVGYMLAASRQRLMGIVERAGHGTGRLALDRLLAVPMWKASQSVQAFVEVTFACIDRVLELNARLTEAKRAYKRALRRQLLTPGWRFAGFENQPWTDVNLGDVFVERDETNQPDLPLLSITNDRGVIPRGELDKRDTSNPDKTAYKRVAVGDIAYNTMRMWQGVSALSTFDGIVSPAYTVAIPTDRIDGQFAKHLFKYPPVVHLFYRHSQGLVDDTLNLKFDRFAKIRVAIPSAVLEQRRIASALDACDREIQLLENLQGRIELQRRAMLSRLLSGDLAVPQVLS